MSETPRQTAERIAAEKYPPPNADVVVEYRSPWIRQGERDAFVAGYLAGRTVSVAQVEAAARAIYASGAALHSWATGARVYAWEHLGADIQSDYRNIAREGFHAAGLRIEGCGA